MFQSPLCRVKIRQYRNIIHKQRMFQSPLCRVKIVRICQCRRWSRNFNPLYVGSKSSTTFSGSLSPSDFNPLYVGSKSDEIVESDKFRGNFNPLYVGSKYWNCFIFYLRLHISIPFMSGQNLRTELKHYLDPQYFNPLYVGSKWDFLQGLPSYLNIFQSPLCRVKMKKLWASHKNNDMSKNHFKVSWRNFSK